MALPYDFMTERILILSIDIDNDLYQKTGISGPVIGRNANLSAASKLALADPLDPDSNVMFEAVKKFDSMKAEGFDVIVATITGAEKEGYFADVEISRQIDKVLDKFKIDSCILVSDGASDNRAIPLLKTRVKINSVDIVVIKSADKFENTYFTILEKLKEPHYARIVFGIPAILLMLFALSYYFNFGWQLPAALIGIYLLIKGFGLEDALVSSFRGLGFSIERFSFIFYMSAIFFFILSVIISYGTVTNISRTVSDPVLLVSYAIEGFLLLFPLSISLYLVGRILDLENKHLRYKAINNGIYIGYTIIVLTILYFTASWVIGQIYFWQYLAFYTAVILLGYGISKLSSFLKRSAIKRSNIKGKYVLNDIGGYIGKITAFDTKRGVMLIKTDYNTLIKYDIDRIVSISDKVLIK
jgi:putative membrane protein